MFEFFVELFISIDTIFKPFTHALALINWELVGLWAAITVFVLYLCVAIVGYSIHLGAEVTGAEAFNVIGVIVWCAPLLWILVMCVQIMTNVFDEFNYRDRIKSGECVEWFYEKNPERRR